MTDLKTCQTHMPFLFPDLRGVAFSRKKGAGWRRRVAPPVHELGTPAALM